MVIKSYQRENFNRKKWKLKNKMEILDLKITLTEMKNSLYGAKVNLGQQRKERISKCKERSMEIKQSEEQSKID